MKKIHIASFKWPGKNEILCGGSNKEILIRRALEIARAKYGVGLVDRPSAMCAAKIERDDIKIETVEFV